VCSEHLGIRVDLMEQIEWLLSVRHDRESARNSIVSGSDNDGIVRSTSVNESRKPTCSLGTIMDYNS
jgi:hypothetical protein